jgi:hypothetical protein
MLPVPGSVGNEVVARPSPLLWLEEFEQANARWASSRSSSPRTRPEEAIHDGAVWRLLQQHARQRGTSQLPGWRDRQWPGYVYLPSPLIHTLIERKELTIPASWQRLPEGQLTRMVAALAGWQIDRGIYYFTPLADAIIANSQVNLPLRPVLFSWLPSHTLYLDLEHLRRDQPRLPLGLFASLNRNEHDIDEFVLVLDHGDRFEVRSFALQGELPDVLASQLLDRFRQSTRQPKEPSRAAGSRGTSVLVKQESGIGPLPRALLDYDTILHLGLSATLLCCVPSQPPRRMHDAGDALGPRPPWLRWEVGSGLDQRFGDELARVAPEIYRGGRPGSRNGERGVLLSATWHEEKGPDPVAIEICLHEDRVRVDYRDRPWVSDPALRRNTR